MQECTTGIFHFKLAFQNYLKNSLTIRKENTKKNHNRILSLYEIKTRLLFSSNFLGLFPTFLAGQETRSMCFIASKTLGYRPVF